MTTNTTRRNVIITDLDQSDNQQTPMEESHRKVVHKKRSKEKHLQTLSGNFSRRSQSAECKTEDRLAAGGGGDRATKNAKQSNYFHDLLQSKDKQMEKLLQRLATVHKFNEQFADENQRLISEAKALEQRISELQLQIANCEKCHRLEGELRRTEEDNHLLTADVNMMKTLVYRLNVQIERYQDILRLKPTPEETSRTATASGPSKSSISQWQEEPIRSHTLAPLLQSYDEMIRDKEDLIQQYTQEFEHFTGELKSVLEENNRLQQQVDTLKRDGGNWREEKARIQAQLEICRQKADAQTRKTDLAKEKLVEVMHCYEQKIQTLVLDMEHLQNAYTRCKAELVSLKSIAALPQDTIASSLKECKDLLEQLRQQHSKEKNSLERTIGELTERHTSVDGKVERLKHENFKLKTELEKHSSQCEELRKRNACLQRSTEKVKRSRDRIRARLRIALQWTQKLEENQANLQSTWDAIKRLETIVKHKESQVRGLHARHLQEIDKMEKKLAQKEETIKTILRDRLNVNSGQQ
ncbi:protein Cep89 homolog isoform X1 [Stomoxys calcitrans]|uniref:protein Cep89 homolog isoform X1 n=1 Tax=Stomoxys calcitrans TaxID=35570 RepID=UPI0027E28BCC|nr:protein Cep89 homolog isoform X1 [Stomoxys calcitrans]